MRPAGLSFHVYAFITVLLWSSAYVFTKFALDHFSPAVLGLLRCAVAGAALLAVLAVRKSGLPRPADIPRFLLTGAAGFAVYLLLFNKGAKSLGPTTSCIIVSTAPAITALLASLFFRERLTLAGWTSMALSFAGVVILSLWNGAPALNSGIIWMFGAALCISIYNVLQRLLPRQCGALPATAWSFAAGTVLLLPFLPEAAAQIRHSSYEGVALVLFLGICPSAAAYLAWAKAVSLAPKVSAATNYMFLTPFLALLLEWLLMGTLPDAGTFIGGACILAGLALFTTTGRK